MHTLGDIIARNAICRGEKDAFICGNERVSWREHAERARRLGSAIYALGARRQDRVAILAMNCMEYYELYAACAIAGFIAAPVNYRLAAPEMLYILNDAAPKVLFYEAKYEQVIKQLRSGLGSIDHYVCIDGDASWAIGYQALRESGSSSGAPIQALSSDAPFLLYTSGTTGRPKGVIHTHEGICAAAEMTALASQFTSDSRVLQTSPAFHSGGTIYVNSAAWMGGAIVIHREFLPAAIIETIHRERITHTFMVPSMLQAVMDSPALADCDTSSIRVIHSAGAPIAVSLLRRSLIQFGPVFAIQYGSTETYSICSMPPSEVVAEGSEIQVGRLASVGQAIPGVSLRIVDDGGNDCDIGNPGELWVRSDSNLVGYWNNHVASYDTITDGWYHTGDIGYFDKDRYVFLVDRKKDMIISGGENIYSREVEGALLAHAEIADAAVIGIPHEKWGEAVLAIVVRVKGAMANDSALINHCKGLIASYKCPKGVVFVEELPRLGTGKTDKVALRRMYS